MQVRCCVCQGGHLANITSKQLTEIAMQSVAQNVDEAAQSVDHLMCTFAADPP